MYNTIVYTAAYGKTTSRSYICCGASEQRFTFLTQEKSRFAWLRRCPLDHNASRASNHNALRHSTSWWHVMHEFFHARKKPLIRNFIVSGNGILGKLTTKFGCKSAAITMCWYTSLQHKCQWTNRYYSLPIRQQTFLQTIHTWREPRSTALSTSRSSTRPKGRANSRWSSLNTRKPTRYTTRSRYAQTAHLAGRYFSGGNSKPRVAGVEAVCLVLLSSGFLCSGSVCLILLSSDFLCSNSLWSCFHQVSCVVALSVWSCFRRVFSRIMARFGSAFVGFSPV